MKLGSELKRKIINLFGDGRNMKMREIAVLLDVELRTVENIVNDEIRRRWAKTPNMRKER